MYYTRGFREPIEVLVCLSCIDGAPRSAGELRKSLFDFLFKHQVREDTFHPHPRLVTEAPRYRALATRFHLVAAAELDRLHCSPGEEKQLEEALDLLPPGLRQLYELVVNEVVLYRSPFIVPGSGALLDHIGTMYVAVKEDWTARDIAECIVHETTHMLLWLDELRYGHHPDPWRTGAIEEFGLTSITASKKSATVVFHSYVTAAEILGLRQEHEKAGADWSTGAHGPTPLVLERTAAAYRALHARNDLETHFTDRALALMESARHLLDSILVEGRSSRSSHA